MIRLVPFEAEHAASIELRAEHAALEGVDMLLYGRHMAALGPAVTGMDGDEVVACFGVAEVGGGVGDCWMLTSETITRHPLALMRAAKRLLPRIMRDRKITVLRALAARGFDRAQALLERLHFERRGAVEILGRAYLIYERGV